MERKARDSRQLYKKVHREMRPWLAHVLAWAVTLGLLIGSVVLAPSWHSVIAVALIVGAYGVQTGDWGRKAGPYASIVAHVIVTRSLFLEDSEGRTRGWLGLENEYGDEHGPRLVLYDAKGQARLALRNVWEEVEAADEEGREAEVVPSQEDEDGDEFGPEPTLVVFGKGGNVIWRAP